MMQPGTYKGKVSRLFYSESSAKRTPGMAAVIDLGANTTRVVNFWLTDACWEYSEPKLRKIGWNGETEEAKVQWDRETEFEWDMTVEARQDKPGQMQERWDLGGRGPRPVNAPPDKAALFKARFQQGGPPTTPTPRPAVTPTPPTNGTPPSPPASSVPIKRPAAPPPTSNGEVKDKASAWAMVHAMYGSVDTPDVIQEKWFTALGIVEKAKSKAEESFAAEDWSSVVAAYPPF